MEHGGAYHFCVRKDDWLGADDGLAGRIGWNSTSRSVMKAGDYLFCANPRTIGPIITLM
jgi:hypothetical protein